VDIVQPRPVALGRVVRPGATGWRLSPFTYI